MNPCPSYLCPTVGRINFCRVYARWTLSSSPDLFLLWYFITNQNKVVFFITEFLIIPRMTESGARTYHQSWTKCQKPLHFPKLSLKFGKPMKFRGGFIILCLKASFVIVRQQCRGFRRRTRSLLGQPWRLHDHQSVAPLLTSRVSQKALNIALHSANPLLELLLSGKCYKAITKRTWRFRYNLFTQTTMSMNRGRWLSTDWSRLRVCVDDVFVPPTLYHVG